MKKVVACGMTENYFEFGQAALNSLVVTNPDTDMVYLFTNVDEYPYELEIPLTVVNYTRLPYYDQTTSNWNNQWTPVILQKMLLAKVLPADIDYCLWIDADTIVCNNLNPLWELPMQDYYLRILHTHSDQGDSINDGVVFFNLKKIRAEGIDDIWINNLNTINYPYITEDCFLDTCQTQMGNLPAEFNAMPGFNIHFMKTYILHFADLKVKTWSKLPIVQRYLKRSTL